MFQTKAEREEEARLLKSQAALAEFKKLMPGLKNYATTVVGRPVSVKPGANNSTDGKTIYLRPPMKLAERREHDRLVCGDRDYEGNQVCPACEVREDLIAGMHHEIAHIVHESFHEWTTNELDYYLVGNTEMYLGRPAQDRYHTWRFNNQRKTGRVMDVARFIDPHLGIMWMALEDVRINRASYEERPGLESAHRARYQAVIDNGIPAVDGTVHHWNERPIDHQVVGGIMMKLHKVRIAERHLAQEARDALEDAKLKKILNDVPGMKNSMDSIILSMRVVQRLRQMGLLQVEAQDQDPEDDEPEAGPSLGNNNPEESNDSEQSDQPDQTESESGDGDGGGSGDGTESGEPGEGGGAGSEGGADQEEQADQDSSPEESGEAGEAGQSGSSAPGQGDQKEGDASGDTGRDTPSGGAEPDGGAAPDSPAEHEGGQEEANEPADATPSEPEGGSGQGEDLARDSAEGSQREVPSKLEQEVEILKPRSSGSLEGMRNILRTLFGHDEQSTERNVEAVHERNEDNSPQSSYSDGDKDPMAKVIEAMWFLDRVPRNIQGVKVHEPGAGPAYSSPYRTSGPSKIPESLIGRAVTQARIAFSVNARVEHHRNQKRGRIASATLGKRAPLGDARLFKKKIMPDKRNYAVLIGFDVSMSTVGRNAELIRESVQALAEVCHRIGVDVSIYAHSTEGRTYGDLSLSISKVKDFKERWSGDIVKRLDRIGPVSGNLDGHSLQFYRKQLDAVRATDKILFYFTDGAMPAANYEEELAVLQEEISVCKKRGYTLLGVGINTNSPEEHGLETVEVDGPGDVGKVVAKLQKKLAG